MLEEKKLRKQSFDLDDYLSQFETMNKMGGIKDVLAMLPGMGSKIKISEADIDEKKITLMREGISPIYEKDLEELGLLLEVLFLNRLKGKGCAPEARCVLFLFRYYSSTENTYLQ